MHFRIEYKSSFADGRPPDSTTLSKAYDTFFRLAQPRWMNKLGGIFLDAAATAVSFYSLIVIVGVSAYNLINPFKEGLGKDPLISTIPVPYKQVKFYFKDK
jgi:hypothetical protein